MRKAARREVKEVRAAVRRGRRARERAQDAPRDRWERIPTEGWPRCWACFRRLGMPVAVAAEARMAAGQTAMAEEHAAPLAAQQQQQLSHGHAAALTPQLEQHTEQVAAAESESSGNAEQMPGSNRCSRNAERTNWNLRAATRPRRWDDALIGPRGVQIPEPADKLVWQRRRS